MNGSAFVSWEDGVEWESGGHWEGEIAVTTISEALKKDIGAYFLIELNFNGWIQRFTDFQGGVIVSYAAGTDLFFDGKITNDLEIGASLDFYSLRQSLGSVNVDLANDNRFQDHEKHHILDGGIGKIYLWSPSLDWSDIENYPIFCGTFRKQYHDKNIYSFTLEDIAKTKLKQIAIKTIDIDTWPLHRSRGNTCVTGEPQPLLFGDWPGVIPLSCVHVTNFVYQACLGKAKSVDADYTATTENVYDKDGAVIAAANYAFVPAGWDAQGNVVAYFDFTGDQEANEPLSCSIRGLMDGSGEYTGTAGNLLEHPADICYYLLRNYTNLDSDEISVGTLKTMRSLLSGIKFATIINQSVAGIDVIDRMLIQCQCIRIHRWGKTGVVILDINEPVTTGRIKKFDLIGSTAQIAKTPYEELCNDLKVFYGLNPTTGKWEYNLTLNETNDRECKKSYYDYGEQAQRTLYLADVQLEYVARACAERYLQFRRFRHDVVACVVPYCVGWDVLEGDGGLLTVEEGPSNDGTGWIDEPCILLERKFSKGAIYQKWWRVGTN